LIAQPDLDAKKPIMVEYEGDRKTITSFERIENSRVSGYEGDRKRGSKAGRVVTLTGTGARIFGSLRMHLTWSGSLRMHLTWSGSWRPAPFQENERIYMKMTFAD
jgi:hypothetical protein